MTVLGKLAHAWFDIHDFSDRTIGEREGVEGLRESAGYLVELVAREEEGILGGLEGDERDGKGKGRGRVGLLGFSQGCAMGAVLVLAGMGGMGFSRFVGMSGWLPFCKQV